MLQLRMKGLKRTIYYLFSLKAQLHLLLCECDLTDVNIFQLSFTCVQLRSFYRLIILFN
jgi:hypothetical protein